MKLLEKKSRSRTRKAGGGGREQRVAEAAYFLAEKRGFEPGHELDDWFMAENMVDAGAEAGLRG